MRFIGDVIVVCLALVVSRLVVRAGHSKISTSK